MAEKARLADIRLDERTVVRRNPDIEHERAVAIYDLLEENTFAPAVEAQGPYNLVLSVSENRLLFDIRDSDDAELTVVPLSLQPFKRTVKDYFTVCESYFAAIKTASPSKIEAIDMGRRGLHNEGSELLQNQLKGRIEIDFDTARRLFTLLCVLHIKV
ncbi:MAG: UPF0262 family protein [Rhodospirillaceae bacterium]|nr:UPF0262 family protein [Rhodospirillaceae bacterium]